MSENGHIPDLDLTDLLPQRVRVKAGGQEFVISNDLPPSLLKRLRQWYRTYTDFEAEPEPAADDELWQLVGQALECAPENVRTLGFTAVSRLVAYLVLRPSGSGPETTPSETLSPSAASTAEA